jgi:hypothetical protein
MTDKPFFYSNSDIKNDINKLSKKVFECDEIGKIIRVNKILDMKELGEEDGSLVVKFCTLLVDVENTFLTITEKIIRDLINRPEIISSTYAKFTYQIDETIRAQILQCMGFNDSVDNLVLFVRRQKIATDKVLNFSKDNSLV